MPKNYPPLTPKQVCKILEIKGFQFKNNRGDHRIYEDDDDHNVQVDMGEKDFGTSGMKIILNNTGMTREEFYGATKETARKISIKFVKPKK